MTKKFQVMTTTEGCATNLLENSTYRQAMEKQGWTPSAIVDADVIVLNTCGHTQEREDHTFKVLKNLKEQYPDKKIVVGGCLAKINPTKLNEVHTGKTFAPGNVSELWSALGEESVNNALTTDEGASVTNTNFFDAQDFEELTWMHRLVIKLRPIFYRIEKKLNFNFKFLHNIFETVVINQEFYGITIGQGCAGKCTFCAIKTAKGHIRSKPLDEIIDEFYKGIKSGHDKFWLLGDDIGCYGIDRGITLVDLLKEISKIDYPFKLVINYFEPMFFVKYFDQIKGYLADPRIININIPIQSGSPRIVKEMGRDYSPEQVLKQLKELKKLNPNLVIKNNIIVGFPGETWSDLWLSIKSLFYFDANLAIPFAKRPGTRAAKMDHQISEIGKKFRHSFMNIFVIARHLSVFVKSLKPFSTR